MISSKYKNNVQISAVIATYNSESTIDRCLETLLDQTMALEIIVVDDGSTDNTKEAVAKYKNLKYYKRQHDGPASSRNFGVKKASGSIILFADADMYFARSYASTLIAPILMGKAIGTFSSEERVANWDNIWARCWNIEEGWEAKKRFPKNPPEYGTDFRAILRSEFERVGGFDNIGYTDSWSLFYKLGVRPLATNAICYHKNPATLSDVYRQSRWSAKRPYKYGLLGTVYALLRASIPVSLIVGVARSYKNPFFVPFKIVYDWGRFVGIITMLTTGKLSK